MPSCCTATSQPTLPSLWRSSSAEAASGRVSGPAGQWGQIPHDPSRGHHTQGPATCGSCGPWCLFSGMSHRPTHPRSSTHSQTRHPGPTQAAVPASWPLLDGSSIGFTDQGSPVTQVTAVHCSRQCPCAWASACVHASYVTDARALVDRVPLPDPCLLETPGLPWPRMSPWGQGAQCWGADPPFAPSRPCQCQLLPARLWLPHTGGV